MEVVWEHGGLRKGKWGNRERGERRERGCLGVLGRGEKRKEGLERGKVENEVRKSKGI